MTIWGIIQTLRKSKSRYIASMLEELEQALPDEATYSIVRKIVLDHFNDFYRTVFKQLLGVEVEGQRYK